MLSTIVSVVSSTGYVKTKADSVFVDLGFSPKEAAILQMRADLMAEMRKVRRRPRRPSSWASANPACPTWSEANGRSSASKCSSPWPQEPESTSASRPPRRHVGHVDTTRLTSASVSFKHLVRSSAGSLTCEVQHDRTLPSHPVASYLLYVWGRCSPPPGIFCFMPEAG
jgi:hypothetical protein